MPKKLDNLAKELLRPMSKRDVILLNFYTSLWGLWVANPLWETFSRSHLYSSLQYIFPEWVWGLGALAVGVLSVYALLRGNYLFLRLMSKCGAVLWFVISLLYVTADYASTAWLTAFVIASFYFLKAINISVNKCHAFNQ